MPPSLQHLRRRIIDIPEEWLTRQIDPVTGKIRRRWRAKTLSATVGERVVERQCQRAENSGADGETE
jgi:hypothetical protein